MLCPLCLLLALAAGVPVSPGLLQVLAPVLAVLTLLLLSLLATLTILYLVNAHRVAALRKKRYVIITKD